MITTKNLAYWYDNADEKLFEDINLQFDAGKLYAIIGKSGSGKTTFLSLIAGLDTPKSGSIEFEDEPLKKIGLMNYRKKCVSMVFQSYNLLTYMSALDNLLCAMAITGAKHAGDRKYALELLDRIGIDEDNAKRKVTKLSGGQQQRVAIARTMCCDSRFVVADEPTGNLDESSTEDVLELFQQIAHEQNKCVVIVTHEFDVAQKCDSIIELRQKKFEQI